MKLTEEEVALVEDIRETVIAWGREGQDCRWTALFELVDRFIKEEQFQPEVKFIKTGMELTPEEWEAKKYLSSWVDLHSRYGKDDPIANVRILITAIDREVAKRTEYVKEQQETKPKIVFYSYYGQAMYANGQLVYNPTGGFDCYSARRAMEALGYEAVVRSVKWEDMPPDPNGNGARGYYAPPILAELEDHFNNLEQARRRARIASLKDELQRLEQEDAKC